MTTLFRTLLVRIPVRSGLGAGLFLAAMAAAMAAPPVITSPSSVEVYCYFMRGGSFTSYQIAATNSPTSYNAAPLPAGTSINTSSGLLLISAEAIPAGIHNVTLSATNADGTGQQTLAIRVHPSPRGFGIALASGVRHTVYYPGDEVRISVAFNAPVTVTGTPSVAGAPYLSGSGSSTLIFGFTVPANTGNYDLIPQSIELNGGTIVSAAGLDASLSLDFGNPGTSPPRVQSAAVESVSRSATVGTSFSYQPAHSVPEPTFRASGLPAGLSIAPATGVISGTPEAAGTFPIEIGATGPGGRPNVTGTLTLTVAPASTPPPPLPPAPIFVTSGSATGVVNQIFNYTVAVSGSPSTFSAAGLPPGLSITNTGLISGTPIATGVYSATVTAANSVGGSGSGTITLTINAPATPPPSPPPPPGPVDPGRQNQSIEFTTPVSALIVNQPILLGANASSNLPITFSIVSGNATLEGNQLTLRDTNPAIVRATQAGSATYNAATAVDVVFTASRAAQAIAFAPLSDVPAAAGPIALEAASSSGLPVTYTVTGPARLDGNVLILTGAPGFVTVRATQGGNAAFAPAGEVVRTFTVRATGAHVYLGNVNGDAFGAAVSADGSAGVFVMRLAATGEAIVLRFAVNADGSIVTTTAGAAHTLAGRIVNGRLEGRLVELGADFIADAQPAAGPTAALAGLYLASVPGSASGSTYVVAGSGGQAYALGVTASGSFAGNGTISPAGLVEVPTSAGETLTATINAATGGIAGIVRAGGVASSFIGLSHDTERTDRLANLSSRLNVGADDASRAVVAGFVVSGTEPKPVLVRAIGPGLAPFAVPGAHANPRLQVYRGDVLVAENDDWNNSAVVSTTGASVGAFNLPANSRDAALFATLPPGAYTAVVQGEGAGVVLIEVYDAAGDRPRTAQQLVNISTRGFVDTGDARLIAGFVVAGNAPKRVLIRGIGPGLTQFEVPGAVADPLLEIYVAGSSSVIARNDNWGTPQPVAATQVAATGTEIAAVATAAGAFPLPAGSNDAAIVITLLPGQYSAVMSGANDGTGAGLIEVYELNPP